MRTERRSRLPKMPSAHWCTARPQPTSGHCPIEPLSVPKVDIVPVDIDAAVRRAFDARSDLEQVRRTLEATNINIRYCRNQTLPDVSASVDYGVTGLGGTQFLRGTGFPGPVIGQTQRGFGNVLSDVFRNDLPNWSASLSVSYQIGTTPEEASLARARLQYSQSQTDLRYQQVQVATEVRRRRAR